MNNPAKIDYDILDAIVQRWSPRSFSDNPVELDKLRSLFEAARWAASAFNEQPWRFIVATKDNPAAYDKALGCLVEANQEWAKAAPVLVLTAVGTRFKKNDKPNRVALHDLGQSAAHIGIQAANLGLAIHQMAGVDTDKVASTYGLPDGYQAQTAIAIGYPGDVDELPEQWMRDAETAGRSRLAFDDFVFGEGWGKVSGLF